MRRPLRTRRTSFLAVLAIHAAALDAAVLAQTGTLRAAVITVDGDYTALQPSDGSLGSLRSCCSRV